MKYMLTATIMLFTVQIQAAEWDESQIITELFDRAGVSGTFVVHDVDTQRFIGHNRIRANTRFVPASTFKIPNTLIGLSVGAAKSVDEVLPYGGHPQPFKAWERDMGLRDAIALSNVAIYQELARRIGLERMRDNIAKLGYGNVEVGTAVDTFWLNGPLKISAVEQSQFLARLAQYTLPFPRAIHDSTREIIQVEQSDSWTLYGKTGWENAPGQGIGWWVGWVQKNNRVYSFALNMDIRQASDASKRIELGKAGLKALGIL